MSLKDKFCLSETCVHLVKHVFHVFALANIFQAVIFFFLAGFQQIIDFINFIDYIYGV